MVRAELRASLLQRLKPIHERLRRKKMDLFLEFIGKTRSFDTLLDIGGGPGINGEFLSLYDQFAHVVVTNVLFTHQGALNRLNICPIMADGCALPFRSHSFDWVFSNAVIEHVGDFNQQKRFADEVRRVAARGYFIATPNKHFPIEPHTMLPFYQFLSPGQQRYFVRLSPGYVREYLPITLLSCQDLSLLFPEARVLKTGFPAFPNSLVAMHKSD